MHKICSNLENVQKRVNKILTEKKLNTSPKIIVVTKTFSLDYISPLINSGYTHFGENKVQEAIIKWEKEKIKNKKLQLHMVGKLQSNKIKKALEIFDYIHSLDNQKMASIISQIEKNSTKKVKLFIQVNVGEEKQKSGINLNDLDDFYNYTTKDLKLNVIGLMCLPPVNVDSSKYFKILKNNCEKFNLKDLSMGMSYDYEQAVLSGSTFLRLGTAILGERNIRK